MNHRFVQRITESADWLRLLVLAAFLLSLGAAPSLQATHIVGGQLSYKALGNNKFEVTIIFRRDCLYGADTVPFDNPALLGVFYGDHQKAFRIGYDGVVPMVLTINDTLHETIDVVCPGNYEAVCVHQTIYRDTIVLPFDERGYILTYQRCCRNRTLQNIENPLDAGATYTAFISPNILREGNASPIFGDFPPIYSCAGKPFEFNHSAIDPDGDSLVYFLCAPYIGKTMADPAGKPDPPPYDTVSWRSPYNINNLVGSALIIDPATGMISAMPMISGQFLVGVCVKEYRNGVLIGEGRRDFELNIVPCGTRTTADFSTITEPCDGLEVRFSDNSTEALSHQWFFDWPNNPNLFSNQVNPVFRYPNPGVYMVLLVTQNGNCSDSIIKRIEVWDPGLKADFDFLVECEEKLNIQIIDRSNHKDSIASYDWLLIGPMDTLRSNEKNPKFMLKGDGTILITLILTDIHGCADTLSKLFETKFVKFNLKIIASTICEGDSTFLLDQADPLFTYQWSPTTDLDLTHPNNPIARPKVTTTYHVTVSDGACKDEASITVTVKEKINVDITGPVNICNDSVILTAIGDSTTVIEWSDQASFNPIIFRGNPLVTRVTGSKTFYVRAGSAEQCPDSASFTVTNRSIQLRFDALKTVCVGDSLQIFIQNASPGDTLLFKWDSSIILLSPLDAQNPFIRCLQPGRYTLYFETRNQYGCDRKDSIIIESFQITQPDFTVDTICGSLEIKVQTAAGGKILWDFGDGIGQSTQNPAQYRYGQSGKYRIRLLVDTLCSLPVEKEIILIELKLDLKDSIILCHGDSIQLNPGADPKYRYEWTPVEGLDDPNIPNPKTGTRKNIRYHVRITDPHFPELCDLRDSIDVFVPERIQLEPGPDTLICFDAEITLHAVTKPDSLTLQWCDDKGMIIGSGSSILVHVEKSGYYVIKARDAYGCSDQDTIHVESSRFSATIHGGDLVCKGDSTRLWVLPSPPGSYSYNWDPKTFILGNPNDSSVVVNPNQTSRFAVTITDEKGCQLELDQTVTVRDITNQVAVTADPDKVVPGQSTQLTATFNPDWKYLWQPQDGSLSDSSIYNPVARPLKTTTYTVTATDENGCTGTATVTITVFTCEESVFLPNAFSPNGDQKNDILFVRARPNTVTKMELVIFSRWGEKVFESRDIQNGWDGRFKGVALPPDVFGYGLRYQCWENTEIVRKGNISLLK